MFGKGIGKNRRTTPKGLHCIEYFLMVTMHYWSDEITAHYWKSD